MTDDSDSTTTSAGAETERRVREIAAQLGVADFVYTCVVSQKGKGVREVSGDGLLLVGDDGAVLQVKSRDPDRRSTDDHAGAERWIRKSAAKAKAQGRGTRRELARRHAGGAAVAVTPARALSLEATIRSRYTRTLEADPSNWPIIVVIDHPLATGVDLGLEDDVVWLSLNDWTTLHHYIRSTTGLLDYFRRLLTDKAHAPLGHEAVRYVEYAEKDIASANTSPRGAPILVHPNNFDAMGFDLYRDIVDKVWLHDGHIPWDSADDYRRIVEFLDRVPPGMVPEIGRKFLAKRGELRSLRRRVSCTYQFCAGERLVYVADMAANRPDLKTWATELTGLAHVRHASALATGAPEDTATLVVGCLVSEDPTGVLYTFIFIKGEPMQIPRDVVEGYERVYGSFKHGCEHMSPDTTLRTA